MTIDSTHQKLHTDVKSANMKTPKKSTLDFIRQFAMVCEGISTTHASIMIAN